MMKEMRETVVMTVVALLAVVLIALIAACGGSSSGSDDAAGHSDGGVVDAGDELVITMRTEDFKFVPDTITIKVGQTVRLRLDNHDGTLHDYTTDEAEFIVLEADGAAHEGHEAVAAHDDGREVVAAHDDDHGMDPAAQVSLQPLHIAAEANDHGELVFEATEAGEYEFYCSVPGHREAGMTGKMIIEE